MDGELLRKLYHELFHHGKPTTAPRFDYSDAMILWIHFIAVLHDRSHRWAHSKRNWPLWSRGLKRPSYSQLMRRLKTPAIRAHLEALNDRFRSRLPNAPDKAIDGKPMVVGVYSKDPDAKRGRLCSGAWGRGYKLHAIVDQNGGIDAYTVTGLNAGESTIARELVAPLDLSGATLRADANYDAGPLYEAVAARGGRLVAQRRKPGTGVAQRSRHPHRLQAIAELENHPDGLLKHERHRLRVEQTFGRLTNLPFGLAPLPNWVRRQGRVERWVAAKIVLYHLHLAQERATAHAA